MGPDDVGGIGLPSGGAPGSMKGFLTSLRAEIDRALSDMGVTASQPTEAGPEVSGRFRPSPWNPDIIEFVYAGKKYAVSSIELTMMFTIGKLVQVKIPDPVMNPGTKFFGVSPAVEAFLRVLATVPPGDYSYRLSTGSYLTVLLDASYQSNDGNAANPYNPGGGAFTGSSSVTNFLTRVVSCADLQAITFILDNETNQSATLNALAMAEQNGKANGPYSNVTVGAGVLLPLGVDLTDLIVPYMQGQAKFSTAPTSGYLRLLAYGRRA